MFKNLEALIDEKELRPGSLAAKNQLLTELLASTEARNLLFPQLRIVPLERNQVLYEQGDAIETVYFPIDSIVSSLAIMEDGTTLETSMVGREGLVGVSAILGSGVSRHWHWVSISGNAIQLDASSLDHLFLNSEDSLKSLLCFYRSLITQVSQRCVCNTRHTVLERLCCWLLMVHDRVGGGNLRLTQEMIASRLGARRAGITVAAGVLQAMHAIEYRRGQLHITEREVLERAVCECYAIMRNDFKPVSPQKESRYSGFSL
ncbi:MAG TPA: Crp/Fnr family transcriptional regulator [Pyrinomonadaceae bacterium]|nr:Crp/Fnr family transcriptional regulator [Pyrinomonadaceae bacterium]